MRVVVATTVAPFQRGGDRVILAGLVRALRERGHETVELRLPFLSVPAMMPEQMLGLRALPVEHLGDRLVAIRTPSHVLRHPQKSVWFIHHHRGAFDLVGTEFQDVPDGPRGSALREMLRSADDVALREARRVFTNSAEMSDRVRRYNRLDVPVLYPPLPGDEQPYRCTGYGDSLLYVARMGAVKRQHVAVRALATTRTPVRLVLAGGPTTPGYGDELRALACALGVDDRLTVLDRHISDDEKVQLTGAALACLYLAQGEDSYGYSSLEAQHAGKAVVGMTDCGGLRELVRDGDNGFLTEPDPVALGARFDELYEDRELARRLGERGPARMAEIGISWDTVVRRLLS